MNGYVFSKNMSSWLASSFRRLYPLSKGRCRVGVYWLPGTRRYVVRFSGPLSSVSVPFCCSASALLRSAVGVALSLGVFSSAC